MINNNDEDINSHQSLNLYVAHLSKGMPKTPWAHGGPGVTLGTCGAGGERAEVILV